MNGLTAARGLRRSLDEGSGVMRISVTALGDVFGRGRVTTRARAGMQAVLTKAGLEVEPPLTDPATDWVTLRVAPEQVEREPAGAVAAPAPPALRPRLRVKLPASLAAAAALLFPLLLAGAIVLPDAPEDTREPAPAASVEDPRKRLLDRADGALLAGDYKQAIKLTQQADPSRVPGVRQTVVTALLTQARAAQEQEAHVRAIRLARRASRFGPAPGAKRIVERSRAGLDRRRALERRAARRERERSRTG